ncbi:hypothetical protein MLD38_018813 [Melastoma candidum]|uniref:Uncharacterized protein n=1 Tax=Melastoma candidum TaxID=119954 RepID=A0ACB9QVI8_9MYRT|nr:hypothetical protein MLD38_018813 [Melastoma candidum]
MKRFRSSEDIDHYAPDKDKDKDKDKPPSHRPFYSPNKSSDPRGKSLLSYRFERDPPDPFRLSRKRSDHDLLRRKTSSGPPLPDRHSDRRAHCPDSLERDGVGSYPSSRGLPHRSDGFSIPKKEFPKGVRSDRDRSRREGNSSSSSSWHRIGNASKDLDEARDGRSGGFALDRERKVLRDGRSPTWSKDSGSDQSKRAFLDVSWKVRGKDKEKSPGLSRGDSGSEQQSKMSSPLLNPSGVKAEEKKDDAKEKSPSWSCEQSRSFAAKRSAEEPVESGSNSEMEEGQLEPEDAVKPGLKSDGTTGYGSENGSMELTNHVGHPTEKEAGMDVGNECAEKSGGKGVFGTDNVEESGEKEDEVIPDKLKNSVDGTSRSVRDESETESDSVTGRHGGLPKDEVESSGIHFVPMEGTDTDAFCGRPTTNEDGVEKDASIGIKLPEEGEEARELHLGNLEVSRLLKHQSGLSGERPRPVPVDRGKSVTFVPISVADGAGGRELVRTDSRGITTSGNLDEEGPSARGFELFSRSPVRKPEKVDNSGVIERKDDKMEMEPLDLSLSLPNVLLPIGARDVVAAPASPSQGRSLQSWSSFRTISEGFTASISCSGSQSFFHNPSCSLTQNSLDFEQSVKSRPLFQGVDWQALAQSESKHNEPAFQGTVSNGNGYLHHQSQALKVNSNNSQPSHGLNLRVLEGSSGTPSGLDRQLSLHRQASDGRTKLHDDEVKSPSQSAGSHEMGTMQPFERKLRTGSNYSGSLYWSSSQNAREQMLSGSELIESLIEKIVSEPLSEMAGKFHEMQGEVLTRLKESVYEMMVSPDKRRRLLLLKEALQERPDFTMEMLLKCHRSQLEIMVALKTEQSEFLRRQTTLSTSDLAEVFLNMRCRNVDCRSPLPVNECDCKVCMRKTGFCSECMCLLCFKFDMASNTCSWVGCDLCLHWCHVDCAIRESYIRNGSSASGTLVTSEVQFYCVACDHPSEMFGFVKDVFQNFAKEWSAENFRRELEYVRRIFHYSKDVRGRWLYGFADQMLGRLADKANLPEVYNHVVTLLKETDPTKFVNEPDARMDSRKEKNAVAGPSQDVSWLKAVIADKNLQGERIAIDIPVNNLVRNERIILDSVTLSDREGPLFDELESIVRIKHAEAKMFQARADDARREAEGLRRIAVAKNEKTEEEFRTRIAKLRLTEAEEVRKQKSEELQALERSHREYSNMKIRMEADIKDLLLKMEATKRNMAP